MIKLGCEKYFKDYILTLVVGVVVSKNENESRVPLVPQHIKKLIKSGYSILIKTQAGSQSDYSDHLYQEAGAEIVQKRSDILQRSNIILCLEKPDDSDLKLCKGQKTFIGLLSPYENRCALEELAAQGHCSYALELMPRITRAQNMDVLSSQSNLMGYCAVIHAANIFKGIFPMMVTAAGTIKPVRVLVIGAGVAGLQAIATAKRLGAIVHAFDVRAEVKEQVESLGGVFVSVDEDNTKQEKQVYAKEVTAEYKAKQQLALENILKTQDIVITTALIPGRQAPVIVTKEMAELMAGGSVIVDLAGSMGGNCALTQWGKDIVHNDVTISSPFNILNKISKTASFTLSNNFMQFLTSVYSNYAHGKASELDFEILNALKIEAKTVPNVEVVKEVVDKVIVDKKKKDNTESKSKTTQKKVVKKVSKSEQSSNAVKKETVKNKTKEKKV